MAAKWTLRILALGYLAMLLLIPVGMILYKTLEHGIGPVWDAITTPDAIAALELTLKVTLVAVVANTVFGIAFALMMVRGKMPGKLFLGGLVDLPFAVSPVVVGLTLILVYGQYGWFGSWFVDNGYPIIFSTPGIVLATMFVSLPFVAREVIPVLREVGTEQEQAAATLGASPWQTFWRITLPSIRWGVIYGVILSTARALGEIGAVLVVSSLVAGQTLTLPLLVYQRADQLGPNAETGAYAAATELAVISLIVLLAMTAFRARRTD
jgi:sulfate/thiosulfate transport system permease protein